MRNANLCFRSVELRVKVEQFTVTLQYLEAMSTALRDNQHARILCGQFFSVPLQQGRRSGAQVDHDVPRPAFNAANEFHFCMGRALKMHSAHRAGAGRA